MNLSLPTNSAERKNYPLFGGLFGYFGAALAAVANHSWKNNEKHNKGQQPLHWSIDKSNDHAECVLRHALDLGEMLVYLEKLDKTLTPADYYNNTLGAALYEADALAWRALALNQTLRMKYAGAPLPFNARRDPPIVLGNTNLGSVTRGVELGLEFDARDGDVADAVGHVIRDPLPPLNNLDMPAYDPPVYAWPQNSDGSYSDGDPGKATRKVYVGIDAAAMLNIVPADASLHDMQGKEIF